MALNVYSAFYYGHKVDGNNNLINFKEGAGPEKTAEIPVGSYTLTKFLQTVTAALNGASAIDWGYSVDRLTRIVTFTSSSPASLLFGSGSVFLNSPANLLGFPVADILSSTIFVGSFGSGFKYSPQFYLQDYKGKDKGKKLVNAVVTKSASGDNLSVQSFGVDRSIKFNIKYVTNRPTSGTLRNNPSAVEEIQEFMDYVVEKNPVEFMENESAPDTFDKVYLDSTLQGSDGTQYELDEYTDKNLPEFFESGLLNFKVINIE
jgi:hypothetical protein